MKKLLTVMTLLAVLAFGCTSAPIEMTDEDRAVAEDELVLLVRLTVEPRVDWFSSISDRDLLSIAYSMCDMTQVEKDLDTDPDAAMAYFKDVLLTSEQFGIGSDGRWVLGAMLGGIKATICPEHDGYITKMINS